MNRTLEFGLCCLALPLFFGCASGQRTAPENGGDAAGGRTVTFVNGLRKGDAWILPRTPAILKTTVWGPATVAKAATGEPRSVRLEEPGEGGLYVFRMIDADGFYHSADGLVLEDGWTLRIQGNGLDSTTVDVSDGTDAPQGRYDVFSARL